MIYGKTKKKIIVFAMIFLIISLSIPKGAAEDNIQSSDLSQYNEDCVGCIAHGGHWFRGGNKPNLCLASGEYPNDLYNYYEITFENACSDTSDNTQNNENSEDLSPEDFNTLELADLNTKCNLCIDYGYSWDENQNKCVASGGTTDKNVCDQYLTSEQEKSQCEDCVRGGKVWCDSEHPYCSSNKKCQSNEIKITDKNKCEETTKSCTDFCFDHFANLMPIGEYPMGICSEYQVNPNTYNPYGYYNRYSYNPYSYGTYNPVARTTRYLGRLGGTQDVGYRVGCSGNEHCYCYAIEGTDIMNTLLGMNNPYGTSNNPYGVSYNLQPPPQQWDDPDQIKNPPKATQNPPEYLCSYEADRVAHLNISTTLARIGDTVVLSGQVNKTTNMSAGYKYTCRYQHIVNCEVDPGFIHTNIKYKNCPSGTHLIHQEGAKKITNWGNVFMSIGLLVDLITMMYIAGVASGPFMKNFGKLLIGIVPKNAPKVAGKIYAIHFLTFAGKVALTRRGPLPECYRVCAKEETTNVVATSNPETLCGTGYIIKAQKSSRPTIESTPDICGGIGGLRVKIKIKDPNGRTIKQTTVTTDSNGKFSYTFKAPTKEGHYSALITII